MLCLDTYALIEIHDANPKFSGLLAKDCVIADLTLAEFYGVLLRRFNKKTADYWLDRLAGLIVRTDMETYIAAIVQKQGNPSLSFFDCVGYAYARQHHHQFVTGDKEFKGKQGVLFLK